MVRWAESWAASTAMRAPCAWAIAREALDGPHLTGDVGRRRDDDETVARGVVGERLLEQQRGVRRRSAGTGSRTVRARPHGSSVEWCSVPKTKTVVRLGSARREQRPRVGRRAREDDGVVGARPDEVGDLGAGLLVPRARQPGGVAGAAVHRGVGLERAVDRLLDGDSRAGVDAAWSRLA